MAIKKTTKKTSKAPAKSTSNSSGKDRPIPGSPLNLDQLEKLVELMTRADLSEVDLRDGEKRVALRRGVQASAQPMSYAPQAAPQQPAPQAAPSAPAAPAAPVDDTAGLVPIKSPMVGTFYASATPESPAFVTVGKRVGPDTDVCIIEAMKVFNNIKAETAGTVARIVAENGKSVEYGQVLFLIKPD